MVNRLINEKVYLLLYTLLSVHACKWIIDENGISIIIQSVLCVIFWLFYSYTAINKRIKSRESIVIAGLFTVFITWGKSWLDYFLDDEKINMLISSSLMDYLSDDIKIRIMLPFMGAVVGTYIIIKTLLDVVYTYLLSREVYFRDESSRLSINCTRFYLYNFLLFWMIYFIYFLNQYPGSLSCDTPGQLSQALGVTPFENANPLINTLLITICVRIGSGLFGNVNIGVALYTLVQFTMVAAIFAYVVKTIYKKGYHKYIVLFAQVYFGFVPFNIVYATGMWKDTFFSVIFLATLTYVWDVLDKDKLPSVKDNIILAVLSLLCSLARNSGWSSLIAMLIFLVPYEAKRCKETMKVAVAIGIGIISAFIIMTVVYPLFGVTNNGGKVTGLSVPLQQISRVVANGAYLTEEESVELNKLFNVQDIPEIYKEHISDPIKGAVNKAELDKNLSEYMKLWIKLGLKYPKYYLDAYRALTLNYWFPDAGSWIWDTRIFENSFGVERTPMIIKSLDLSTPLNLIMYKIPINSSITLWLLIICMGYASIKKNRISMIIYIPILAIYIGLMFTSPVALFRYTYGAIICMPLFVCLLFSKER